MNMTDGLIIHIILGYDETGKHSTCDLDGSSSSSEDDQDDDPEDEGDDPEDGHVADTEETFSSAGTRSTNKISDDSGTSFAEDSNISLKFDEREDGQNIETGYDLTGVRSESTFDASGNTRKYDGPAFVDDIWVPPVLGDGEFVAVENSLTEQQPSDDSSLKKFKQPEEGDFCALASHMGDMQLNESTSEDTGKSCIYSLYQHVLSNGA